MIRHKNWLWLCVSKAVAQVTVHRGTWAIFCNREGYSRSLSAHFWPEIFKFTWMEPAGYPLKPIGIGVVEKVACPVAGSSQPLLGLVSLPVLQHGSGTGGPGAMGGQAAPQLLVRVPLSTNCNAGRTLSVP